MHTLFISRGRPGADDASPITRDEVVALSAGMSRAARLGGPIRVEDDALGLRVRLGHFGGVPVLLWMGPGYLYSGAWQESGLVHVGSLLESLDAGACVIG